MHHQHDFQALSVITTSSQQSLLKLTTVHCKSQCSLVGLGSLCCTVLTTIWDHGYVNYAVVINNLVRDKSGVTLLRVWPLA